MGKIAVNRGALQANIGTAGHAAANLAGTHLQPLNLGRTNARPFVEIGQLEQRLNGIINQYASLAERDTGQFSHVGTQMQAADQASAIGFKSH